MIVREPHAALCFHCQERIEISPYTHRNPESVTLVCEMFTLEHTGCEPYGDDHRGAAAHRRFVRTMRREMRKAPLREAAGPC